VPTQRWIDLCDPDEATLRAALPVEVHEIVLARLLEPSGDDAEPRTRLEAHGNYVFGILTVPTFTPDEQVVFQEVDIVATTAQIVTIRKTPPSHQPFDIGETLHAAHRAEDTPGMCIYRLIDEIAERFLDVVDRFDDEIDELEDHVLDWPSKRVRDRISQLRHDLLHVRRVAMPTRDAARAVLDDRVELDKDTLFPRDIEVRFADAYDKLLRAADGLDLSRDLLAGVRDFHQSEIANEQNDVTKRLTAIASILLVPTFIVGLYGQNFENLPEFHWRYGYQWSWFLILVTTALQIWYFKRKRWL
jgi:magnesium/cobalt transport protein CorA